MTAYFINSKGVCMTAKMREDRETITAPSKVTYTTTSGPLNTMDEIAYRELEAENKKLKKRAEEAEGETTIVKGIGINSPEMRGLQTENKNLNNSLGDANDKITVLQLRCDNYEKMRLKVLQTLQEMKEIINKKEK